MPLTRPSTSAWLSDPRANVGRTRQRGGCGRARTRTCARGRAGRSRCPPCGGDTCDSGNPNLCSTSAAACCADACNGHRRRADACRSAGPGPPTGTPGDGSSTCSINLACPRGSILTWSRHARASFTPSVGGDRNLQPVPRRAPSSFRLGHLETDHVGQLGHPLRLRELRLWKVPVVQFSLLAQRLEIKRQLTHHLRP